MRFLSRSGAPYALLLSGFVLWSVAFINLYGVQAIGCRLGWHEMATGLGISVQRLVLVVLFVGNSALLAALALWLRRLAARPGADARAGMAFARQASSDLGIAALAATLFTFHGVVWLQSC